MIDGGRARDRALARLARSDWLAAVFVTALYLQLPTLLERRFPWAPEDAITAGALLAAVALRRWYGAPWPLAARRLALFSLPWVLAGVASGLDAVGAADWRVNVVRLWGWAAVAALLAALLDTRRATLRAIYALVAAGAAVAALNCLQFSTSAWESKYLGLAGVSYQNLYGRVDGFRAVGPVRDPNYHAQFLLPLLALAVERIWNAAGRDRILAALAAFVLAPALALTYSRGAMLAIAVLLPVALVAAVRWRVPALGLVLTLGVATAAVAAAGPSLLERLRTFAVTEPARLDDAAMRGRFSENWSALQMFADHPLNGVGLGGFPPHYHEYASRLGFDQRLGRSAHNLYLEVAAETGILGLLGLVTLLGGVVGAVARTHRALIEEYCVDGARRVAGVAAALAGFFTTALFLHVTYRSMLWIWVAVGFAIPSIRRLAASAPAPSGDRTEPALASASPVAKP